MPGFYCPRCDKRYLWRESLAGKIFDCDRCGASLRIPKDISTLSEGVEMVASYSDDDGPPDPFGPFQSTAFDPAEYDHLPTMQSWKKNSEDVWRSIKTPIAIILIVFPALMVLRWVKDELTRPHFVVPNENVDLAPAPTKLVANEEEAQKSDPPKQGKVTAPAHDIAEKSDSEKIDPLFELSNAVIVAPTVPAEELFNRREQQETFMISVHYRINRTERVIVARHYTLHLTFDGETQHLPFENMNREGLLQVKIKPLRVQIPAELKCWVEWKNPEQRGPEIRVSNVVSFNRTDSLPPVPPPPLDDPHALSVVIDRDSAPEPSTDEETIRKKMEEAIDEKELDGLIASLLTLDKWKVRAPLAQLAKMSPMPSKQQELNRVLQELFEKSDHAVRMEILRIWSTWGTEEVVPDIRLALEEGNDFMRIQALQTISQRRFASAVPAVIALARTGKYRTEIQETLTNLGSAAEESVWPLLEGSSVETVKLALRILRRIGTGKSLPRIQKLLNDSDPFVRIEAENCSKDIKQRTN